MSILKDNVALVTGAATGLGAAIARNFAANGAKTIIADVDEVRGRAVAAEIGGDFRALDVSSEEQWLAIFDAIEADYGRIDVIVNNAAIFKPNIPFLELDIQTLRQHQAVNAESAFLGCKLGILAMQQQKSGSIINIASTIGLMALPHTAAYALSKVSVMMLTRLAARVAGPMGIRVNAIVPGAIVTDQLRGNLLPGQSMDDFVAQILPLYPMGRLGTPEDIAKAALFLASDQSSYVTGHLLRVDGGQDP